MQKENLDEHQTEIDFPENKSQKSIKKVRSRFWFWKETRFQSIKLGEITYIL